MTTSSQRKETYWWTEPQMACNLLHNPPAHNEAVYQADNSQDWLLSDYKHNTPQQIPYYLPKQNHQVRIQKARNTSAHFPDLDFTREHSPSPSLASSFPMYNTGLRPRPYLPASTFLKMKQVPKSLYYMQLLIDWIYWNSNSLMRPQEPPLMWWQW